jgi:pectin methylesterase-like acyl-CoA thioesterase
MSLRPLTPFKNDSDPGVWAGKLRALGMALDAQKVVFRDMCILEVQNGFVLHARCKSKNGNLWSSTTREFTLSDFAMNKLS